MTSPLLPKPWRPFGRAARCKSLFARALCLLTLVGHAAQARDEEEVDLDAESSSKDLEAEGTEEAGAAESEGEGQQEKSDEEPAEVEATRAHSPALLTWYGSLEADVGFAKYDAEEEATQDDSLYDHRGRFVVAPLLHLDLGKQFFFEATGQLVAWVKNDDNEPLVAADDAWGKLGKMNTWDIQVGRFEAWRVYQKFPVRSHDLGPEFHSRGVGESAGAFDLFTLEDTGALVSPPVSNQAYYVDIYEVSHILLREEAGSVAGHWFPAPNYGVELHAKYGERAQQNQLGARLALIGRVIPQLQLSLGGEYRTSRTGSPTKTPDTMRPGEFIECVRCGRVNRWGGGGGAVLNVGLVELAVSGAYGNERNYRSLDGGRDLEASRETTSFGGYAQLNFGNASIGGAVNNTRRLDESDNFQKHLQAAGYAFYAIAKDLSLKLVVSYAVGEDDRLDQRDNIPPPHNSFLGARLRLKYFFDVMM
jgi:hypothetical protein